MSSSNSSDANSAPASAASVRVEIGQIARGAGVGFGGNIINYAVSYLFGILVARQIGATDFGVYTLGVTAVSLASRITTVGLDRGLMRYASISRSQGQGASLRRLIWLALLAGTVAGVLGGLIFALYPQVVLSFLTEANQAAMLPFMPLMAIAIPAMTLTGIAIAGTQAFRTMRYRALVVNVIQPLVKLVLALALIPVLGPAAMAPVLAFVVSQVLGTILSLFFLGRLASEVPVIGDPAPGLGRVLARFSAPLLLANVLEYLNGRTEILVLAMFMALDATGIFNAAGKLAGLGLIVLTAFNAIFSPVISDLHHRGELSRLEALFKLVTRWTFAASLPLVLAQLLYAPQFMSLFGSDFVSGGPPCSS